jgi:flavin reductase (DIM6/NTAB) family NADH-FMN oxidoreductase RutF
MTVSTGPSGQPVGAFGQIMNRWPTGVTVVTTTDGGQPAGCTVSTLLCASFDPPLVIASLAGSSGTLRAIRTSGTFGINVLGWEHRHLSQQFAGRPPGDRFRGVRYTLQHRVPILTDAVASAVCAVHDLFPVADHVLLVGRPTDWTQHTAGSPLVLLGRQPHQLTGPPDRATSPRE